MDKWWHAAHFRSFIPSSLQFISKTGKHSPKELEIFPLEFLLIKSFSFYFKQKFLTKLHLQVFHSDCNNSTITTLFTSFRQDGKHFIQIKFKTCPSSHNVSLNQHYKNVLSRVHLLITKDAKTTDHQFSWWTRIISRSSNLGVLVDKFVLAIHYSDYMEIRREMRKRLFP